uniref:Uncharacterized protein n=1 Tax=Oryza barthii TaxID=65489 RepID=A0A0D3EZR4_9ORYZ
MWVGSAEGFPVPPRRLGQRQVAEHGVFVEHVVAEQDSPPEIHPADGHGVVTAGERDDLCGVVEEHLGGSVRDGEHPVPLGRLVDGHRRGGPAADVGVEALKLELHGAPDGGHEAGDDVACAARAADDGDRVAAEGGGVRVGQQPERRAGAGRVDEVVVGSDAAVELVVGVRDEEEGYVGVRADDSGIDGEPVGLAVAGAGAGAVDAEVGEARRAGEAEGDVDAYAGGGGGDGGGGVGDGVGGDWKTTWLAVSGMGSTLSLSTGSLMDTAVDFQRPTSESKRITLNSMGRLMAGDDVAGAAGAADDGDLLVAEGGDARVRQQPEGGGARAWAGRVDEVVVGFDAAVEPIVGVRDAEEGYIGVRAEDLGIDSEPVGALAVAGAGAVDAEVGEARRAGEAEGDMDAYAGGGGGEGGGGVGDGIGGDVSSVFEVHPAWAHAAGGVVVGRQRRRKQQG